jgi:ribosomal protein S18 acetylase RimI-like enzyme
MNRRPIVDPEKYRIRDFEPRDTESLNRLSLRCPTGGILKFAPVRPDDYLAFSRSQSDDFGVFVCETAANGEIVGTISYSINASAVAGIPRRVGYVSDLKVDSRHRGQRLSDGLMFAVSERLRPEGPRSELPVMMAVAEENRVMHERKVTDFRRIGAFDYEPVRPLSFSLYSGRPASKRRSSFRVTSAVSSDLDEIGSLWRRQENNHAFGRVFSETEGRNPGRRFPGVALESTLVLRDPASTIVGSVTVWDQSAIRQVHVTRLSPLLRTSRFLLNSPLFSALRPMRIPAPGDLLRLIYGFRWCFPDPTAEGARTLLGAARARVREMGGACLVLGFDENHPVRKWVEPLAFQRSTALIYLDAGTSDLRSLGKNVLFHAEPALG